jgi:hypothetical protein
MRKEYPPWEYIGYNSMKLRNARDWLNKGRVDLAREEIEESIEQYKLLCRVNYMDTQPFNEEE